MNELDLFDCFHRPVVIVLYDGSITDNVGKNNNCLSLNYFYYNPYLALKIQTLCVSMPFCYFYACV